MKKVLITGIDSFTGAHLSAYLESFGYKIYGTSYLKNEQDIYKCDITDKQSISEVIKKIIPEYIIHLAGISYVGHGNSEDFYKVNTIGTLNLLDAALDANVPVEKIILASSATVYGNQKVNILDESLCPQPVNHYGTSKFSMECMSKNYFGKLPIVITRPFNYTGIGQMDNFLIPKIVKHFKEKQKTIELGNLHVSREFNDVSFICESYKKLMQIPQNGEIVNLATNKAISLLSIIEDMNELAGYEIEVKVNPAFVRKNEIPTLTGSADKLTSLIGELKTKNMKQTLKEMLEA